MDPASAFLEPSYIMPGQLDILYRGMLNMPDPSGGAPLSDLMADQPYAGVSSVTDLDGLGFQEALPPVIDFGVLQAAQQAQKAQQTQQQRSGGFSNSQVASPSQNHPGAVSGSNTRPRSVRRTAQASPAQRLSGTRSAVLADPKSSPLGDATIKPVQTCCWHQMALDRLWEQFIASVCIQQDHRISSTSMSVMLPVLMTMLMLMLMMEVYC